MDDDYTVVRRALETLVGASSEKDLKAMEAVFRSLPLDDDGKAALNAIQALLQTLPEGA